MRNQDDDAGSMQNGIEHYAVSGLGAVRVMAKMMVKRFDIDPCDAIDFMIDAVELNIRSFVSEEVGNMNAAEMTHHLKTRPTPTTTSTSPVIGAHERTHVKA